MLANPYTYLFLLYTEIAVTRICGCPLYSSPWRRRQGYPKMEDGDE